LAGGNNAKACNLGMVKVCQGQDLNLRQIPTTAI
jgi:hypothetical protein